MSSTDMGAMAHSIKFAFGGRGPGRSGRSAS